MTDEQIRMLKSMAPDLADQLLAQVETQKAAAERANAVLKGDTAEALPLFELDNQYYTVKEGKLVSLKAFTAKPEMKADMPAPEMVAAGTTEVEDGLTDEGLDMPDDGPLLSEADIQGIAQAVLAVITPMFDIQKQIGELKSALGGAMGGTPATKATTSGYLATIPQEPLPQSVTTSTPAPAQPVFVETVKAAEPTGLEAIMAQLKELQATVKSIQGDQPEAAFSRPTQSDSTVVAPNDPLLNGYKSVAENPQAVINTFLSGFPGFNGNGGFGQS